MDFEWIHRKSRSSGQAKCGIFSATIKASCRPKRVDVDWIIGDVACATIVPWQLSSRLTREPHAVSVRDAFGV